MFISVRKRSSLTKPVIRLLQGREVDGSLSSYSTRSECCLLAEWEISY
jgi:hypothetical protein